MEERDNAIRILRETKVAMRKGDSLKLKKLSDQTIHTASITQDLDNIALAVVVYSLSKIAEMAEEKGRSNWKNILNRCNTCVDSTIEAIKKNDDKAIHSGLESIRKSIEGSSASMKKNVQNVFTRARINKASKLHEHGISLEKTASLLGLTIYDLADYVGQKEVPKDEEKLCKTCTVKSRVKFAMEMFS